MQNAVAVRASDQTQPRERPNLTK
uniref:Uncharacterized protein n=1 Tax=Arundo donax TaxID=35708 RepID=A0A0A9FDJ2_ARUDO